MTFRDSVSILVSSLLALACDHSSGVPCGEQHCGARQRCDSPTQLCVRDEAAFITITSPARDEVVAGSSVRLAGEVHDDATAVSFVEWTLDNGLTWSRASVDEAGEFSVVVPLGRGDGAETWLTVRAADGAEQQSSASVRFVADSIAPRCQILSPQDGTRLDVAGHLTIRAVVDDGSTNLTAALFLDGAELAVRLGDLGSVTADWTAPVEDGAPHQLKLKARDSAGNACEADATFSVDALGPRLTVSAPDAGAVFGPHTEPLTVRGVVSDGAGGPLAVSVQGEWEPTATNATVTGSEWVRTIPVPGGIDFREQRIVVTATDAAGNSTRAAFSVVLDSVPPTVTLLTPSGKSVFAATDFSATDTLTVSWNVTDGSGLVQITSAPTPPVGATPLAVKFVTSPTDNGVTYGVEVTAADVAGNVTQARAELLVDRVAPRATWSVVDGSRNVAGDVKVNFSEPVDAHGALVDGLGAHGAGTYSSDRTALVISGLAPDTVSSLALVGLTDRAGNPLEGSTHVHFSSAPARPRDGDALATNVRWFEATSDDDGALTLFTAESAGANTNYRWSKWNTVDGGLVTLWEDQGSASTWQEAHLSAWREVQNDLSANRRASLALLSRGPIDTHLTLVRPEGLLPDDTGAFAVVLPRALDGEPAGAAPVGLASLNYVRTGAPSFPLNIRPSLVEARTDRWHAIEVGNGATRRQSFSCGNALLLTPNGCGPGVVVTQSGLVTAPSYAAAATDSCLTEVFDKTDGARHLVTTQVRCKDFQCTPPSDIAEPIAEGLQVARDSSKKDAVLGARYRGATIELRTRTLSPACLGAWTTLGSVNPGPAPGPFRPVVVGNVPALLYVDSTATLRVFVP